MTLRPGLSLALSLFLIPILIFSACAPPAPAVERAPLQAASPTAAPALSPSPAALPTRADSTPLPTPVSLAARLAVLAGRAAVVRGGSFQTEVGQAQSAHLQRDDQVEILGAAAAQSHSLLHVPGLLNAELFAQTKFSLLEARETPEGAAELTLDLAGGHMFVYLNPERRVELAVRTPQATVRPLTPGAEFDVCRTEELTCVVVKRGVLEIDTKDGREIVRAGFAGVVPDRQPLSPVVCAPGAAVIAWEERYRQSAAAPSLAQEIAALPQQACPLGPEGLPLEARILFQDEFSQSSRGWEQGQRGHVTAGYVRLSGGRYYQVRLQGAPERYLSFAPGERAYEDVNIDLKTRTETTGDGRFRYGVAFRRSGDEYYAFVVSPVTQAWYVLKSSAGGLAVLKYGIARRMRGLEGQDTLQVETYGSTFLFLINGRYIGWVRDDDYARGEAGLFVDTADNPDARINFNSLTIWDIPAPAPAPGGAEDCFNAADDDGDGRIDQADPNCQTSELVVASPTAPPSLPTGTPRLDRTATAQPPAATATDGPPATQPPLLPTISLPTLVIPLPTIDLPLPTISLPLPTISLPIP